MPDTDDHDDDDLLPLDPDWDDVPPDLAALNNQVVTVIDADGVTTTEFLVIVPSLFAHARRIREGFYDQGESK